MKKLITIIFMLSFIWANAQTIRTFQLSGGENFAWQEDKAKHTLVGGVSGLVVFWPVYIKTKNENFAFRKSLLAVIVGSACWEVGNSIAYGKPLSIPDMLYSDFSGFITAFGSRTLMKGIKKAKAKKIKQKFDVSDNIYYSLKNPIFIK